MSKILVTGGAGYIGSHVVNLLGLAGKDIIVLDDLSTGRRESVLYGELIVGDVGDNFVLENIFSNNEISAVIHFAGSIIVPESVEKPLKYYKNNTENSLNLINACIKYDVKKFIFSSTAAVYGMLEGDFASEETPTNPINPYGRSKLMTEWCLEDASSAYDAFNFIALRYFNVAGANVEGLVGQCSPLSTHLIKIASETALGKRNKMSIFGDDYKTVDGTCVRDYIHVDDLAQAHLDALEYLDNNNESHTLNCGYGHGATVYEVINAVKKVSKIDFEVELSGRRAGDAPTLVSKADKIKKVIGWAPRYDDLELIVRTALDWERKL